MFNTRADVDRHVENCLKKINTESERNNRCLAFAKLYFKIGDYEQTRRYISTYLSSKPHSADGQLLLGKTLEKLGKTDAALEAYRTSLDLDPKQNSLLMKICELLVSEDINFNHSEARYYCEKAQSLDPHNPVCYSLKERLISSSSNDPNEITTLLLKELENRPTDISIRTRLLRHLLQHNQLEEAYKHASNIEQKNFLMFSNNLSWYETVAEVLIRYQREKLSNNLTWEYWVLLVCTMNKLVTLSLDERSLNVKNSSDYITSVFNFDQTLKAAAKNVQSCPEKQLIKEFLNHFRGQLCFHLATLVFRLAKINSLKYKEASHMTLPLLFVAYQIQPAELQGMWLDHTIEVRREQVKCWHKEASYRCSQAGHVLLAAAKDQKSSLMERATLESSGYWQEKLFKKIFIIRDQQSKITSSFFATCSELSEVTIRLPELSELRIYDETSLLLYPDSLHHYIWIGLNQNLPQLKCSVFDGLQYSVRNINNCAAESLNILDVQSFIYASILCAQSQIEDSKHNIYFNPNKPNILPASVMDQLGTLNQDKWLKSAYKMYRNEYSSNYGEIRLILIKGIEVIRCVGSHGMDVKLLVSLAKIFVEAGRNCSKQSEVEFNNARAELYWKAALPLLEKLKNNQAISYSPNRMFDFKTKEMSLSEVISHIESGKLFNAVQLMKKKEHEKALQIFETLKDPYASFYQAQIYKYMAEEQMSHNKENVTSEMRSQHITLLSHVRDYLYLTLDRLRDPSIDRSHPLNNQLGSEIEKVERMLSRIDPDVAANNRNECDGMSDENSSYSSIPDHGMSFSFQNSTYPNGVLFKDNHNSSLRLENTFRREARPSPERLDAQLRQLAASKDAAVNNVLEQNKIMVESHRLLVEELRGFKDAVTNLTSTVNDLKTVKHTVEELKGIKASVDELKASVDELQNFRNVSDVVYEMKKELSELKKDANKAKNNQLSDEDLYVLEEDYSEYGINSNVSNLNAALYSNFPGRIPAPNLVYGAHALYPGMGAGYPIYPYTGLGIPPQPGPLAFPSDAQLTDLRAMGSLPQAGLQASYQQAALAQAGLPHSGLPTSLLPQPGLTQATLGHPGLLPPTQGLAQGANLFKDNSTTGIHAVSSQSILPSSSNSSFNFPKVQTTVATSKPAPVNVVITSSDPLPTTKTTTTPILSVTIPPQHLKGSIQKSQPHNYQIPLPTTTVGAVVTAPSVMNQAPLPVSTKSLLSNISAPVYSALAEKPSPTKSIGLGFQIEKSLSESFNISNTSDTKVDLNKSNPSLIEEHDPCPDFKPIVPLPDEVPVNTGEENETVLFAERAKLYRYAQKEWRERGVGIIKMLHNDNTGKIRILMRRDQVHKICANHFVTEDMTLVAMTQSDRAFVWVANDFADEEVVLEKLCVKFKLAEEANKFYNVFEDAKKKLAKKTIEEVKKREGAAKVVPQSESQPVTSFGVLDLTKTPKSQASNSLGGFVFTSTPTFKPKNDTTNVTNVNNEEPASSSPFASFTFVKSPNTASSPTFIQPELSHNKSSVGDSSKKAELGGGDAEDSEEFIPTAEFKPVVSLPNLVEVKTGEENAEVLFEHKAKLLRYVTAGKEWKERGIGIMKILRQENAIRFVMRREQVHKVCCNHQLLKEMAFTKMEKNPKAVTWCAQDFSEGEFKTEMFAIRFKTEDITNNFLDTVIKCQSSLNPSNLVDVEEKKEKKSEKKSKSEPINPQSPSNKGFGDKFKPKSGTWKCKNCYIVNEPKDNYCVACETPKNDLLPKTPEDSSNSGPQFSFGISKSTTQFSIPSNQNIQVTSFVFGQKPSDQPVKIEEKAHTSEKSKSEGFGDTFKPKKGSWECRFCYLRNEPDAVYCTSCENPKDETVPKKEPNNKGVNLDTPGVKFTFGFSTAKNPTTTLNWGEAFKPKENSWECSSCYLRNDSESKSCVSCSSPRDSSKIEPTKDTIKDPIKSIDLDTGGLKFNFGMPTNSNTPPMKISFGNTPKSSISFAAGAEADSTTEDKTILGSDTFNFKLNTNEEEKKETTDKFVFGSPQKHDFEFTPRSPRRQSGEHGEEESDGSYVEEEIDNIYFKPVIPLPDKVDVVTGEEQEEMVYCHRAKLFRFVDSEWKERGIGDLKILFKTDSGKFRVLMRRDKILKICLNHALTAEIDYRPKDDKTWLFVAPDFSEGEISRQQFCLRFKTAEVAQEFKKAVNEALKKISDFGTKLAKEEDSDVEFISETQVTNEEEKEAIRLGLPPKFLSYRQLPDCTCEQCKKEDELLKELWNPKPTKPQKSESLKDMLIKPSILGVSLPKMPVAPQTSSPALFANTHNISQEQKTEKTPFKFSFTAPTTISIFGGTPAITVSSSNLVTAPSTTIIFGTPVASQPNLFVTANSPNIFSSNPTNISGSIFSTSFSKPVSTGSIFGAAPAMTTNIFATPVTSNTSIFDTNSSSFLTSTIPTSSANVFSSKPSLLGSTAPTFVNIFGNQSAAIPQGGFSGDFNSKSTTAPQIPTTDTKTNELVLKCDTNLSFAALNASSPGKTFATSAAVENPFASLGAGTPVFGSKSPSKKEKSKTGGKSDEEDNEGNDDYDPHYEPVVPLPDMIVVSTGEEEETAVFNERSKLFRFDGNEWKERGVGQLKVLHHPEKNTYRLLLRREQVHKVVLNQLITADLNMQPLNTCDKAWMWGAYNYAEDEPVLEKLAARFKNTELAKKFYAVIENAIMKIKEQQESKSIPTTVQNFGIEEVSDSEERASDEDVNEEEDEYDDDDRSVMFMKSCKFSELLSIGEWKENGVVDIQIYYDAELYGSRISISDDTGLVLSNTLIGINTTMSKNDLNCTWRAVEWADNLFQWKTLRATFDTIAEAEEFYLCFEEGVGYAQQCDIVDDIPTLNDLE